MVGVPSATETDEVGTITAMFAEPTTPSLVATIAVVPAPTPVIVPDVGSTVATAGFAELQATVRPESALPFASDGTAVARVVSPASIVGASMVTPMRAMDCCTTSTAAEPVAPSLLAVITVEPAEIPVIMPEDEFTAATALLALAQATRLPLSAVPDPFLSVTLAGTD